MEFGMFHEFPALPGRSETEAFDEAMEQVDAAERWGLDAMWLAEIHFAPERTYLSAPLAIASAIAARTRRMKIGIAVQVLPLCHPLRLAEEAATVDQISRGRLIFGVGRSGVVSTYDAYQVPYEESRDRFAEILDIVKRAWTEPRFSYAGKYHSFDNVVCVPKPHQQPLPEIRVAASTPDTFPAIGALGYPIFASTRHPTWSELAPHIKNYHDAYESAGHPGEGQVFVSAPIYIAETEEQARAEAEESVTYFYKLQYELIAESARRSGRQNFIDRAEKLRNLTYADALRGNVLVGTPDTIAKRLRELRDEIGFHGILAELNCGGLIPHDRVLNAIRLLCQDVMPRFQAKAMAEG
ncbi:MAG TPA: LLM class flavin-dependent oxidoreductase [Stellaceae bacterium]|jgi:alkanesulfonate monooxygenase SsuD/methylene tetrahydromethanopterin reductase-like flavin-dependent oxidoreductase (luciferase family)|nr:LLM class flavin-dependent oxidoreductase [Stellaceae bacterium]